MFHVILFNPQIPPNTGNIIRLCANTGFRLHIIEPMAFELDDKRLAQLLSNMSSDESADFFNLLEPGRQESILRSMARKERDELRRLSSYAEGTAGAVMHMHI